MGVGGGGGGGGGIPHAICSAFMRLNDDLCPLFLFVLLLFSFSSFFFFLFFFFGGLLFFSFFFGLFCLYVSSLFLKDVVYCAWGFPSKADSRHKLTCKLTFLLLVHSIDVILSSKCVLLGFPVPASHNITVP